jgi:5-methylcytosine-specific restriction enzyme A
MIKQGIEFFMERWLKDKASVTFELAQNKKYNADLKVGNIKGKMYPQDKKSYSLYSLETAKKIKEEIPRLLHSKCGLPKEKYKIQGSIGQGNPSEIPWICIFDKEVTKSAQQGFYIVYLFNSKMEGVYLSLNQGWTQYENEFGTKEGKIQIKRVSSYSKSILRGDQGFSYNDINLDATKILGEGYELGNICSKYYPINAIPSDEEIVDDLRNLIGVYRELKALVGSDIINIKGGISEDHFQEEIQESKRKELPEGKIEKKYKVDVKQTNIWVRDSNVAYTALDNASFLCENDIAHSTFISARTNKQFVEAHHLVPMEFQGDFEVSIDVPENIVSLCPNCHRAFHYSTNETKLKLVTAVFRKREWLLKKRGIIIHLKKLLEYYNTTPNTASDDHSG